MGARGRRGGKARRFGSSGSKPKFINVAKKRRKFTEDNEYSVEDDDKPTKYIKIHDNELRAGTSEETTSNRVDEEESEEEEPVKNPLMELLSTFKGVPQLTQAIDGDEEEEETEDDEKEESEHNDATNEGDTTSEDVDEDDVIDEKSVDGSENGVTDEEDVSNEEVGGDVVNGEDEDDSENYITEEEYEVIGGDDVSDEEGGEIDVTNGEEEGDGNESDVTNGEEEEGDGNESDVTNEEDAEDGNESDVTNEEEAEDGGESDVTNEEEAEDGNESDVTKEEEAEDGNESDVIKEEEDEDGNESDVTNEDVNDDDVADGEVEDDVIEEDDEEGEEVNDPFLHHVNQVLTSAVVEQLANKKSWKTTEESWPKLGRISKTVLRSKLDDSLKSLSNREYSIIERSKSLKYLAVKQRLHAGWKKVNPNSKDEDPFTDLQRELFTVMNSYSDLLFCRRTHENSDDLRSTYCFHILNHCLKTRYHIFKHNMKLKKNDDVPEEYRDQGLTRPKTLIVVPFRDSAWRIVAKLINILCPEDEKSVNNKKRFNDEYGDPRADHPRKIFVKPSDYYETFMGNTDDNFRFGIAVMKKTMRIFANFYSSDIIIASPLGLRTIVGAEGERGRDYDFLSSIEILVIDQAEVLLMQNWEHLTHILEHFHLQPHDSHDVDFFRVRSWNLEGWSKHYRQSMCFSGISCPEVYSIFSRFCCNYEGIVKTISPLGRGSIRQVVAQLPQVFQRFQSSSPNEDAETRFNYFMDTVFPQFKESIMTRTMIFVPSYFDYVRIRNHFRKIGVSFAQICEYTPKPKVSQARDRFIHAERKHLLYTERSHFYNRYRIKGIHHLVFYQLPMFPQIYSELCNLTQMQAKDETEAESNYLTCTVMFSKYDAHRLAAVVGADRATHMISAEKDVYMFVTGET